jgi:hypothetical protein
MTVLMGFNSDSSALHLNSFLDSSSTQSGYCLTALSPPDSTLHPLSSVSNSVLNL